MDEKSTRIKTIKPIKVADAKPAAEVNRLRTEIDDARNGLRSYVSELDRRRHDALDLKAQIKKHPGLGMGAAVVGVAALAGAVAMVVQSRRGKQILPWAPWRLASSVSGPPRKMGKFLLTALPMGLKVARGVADRLRSRRLRLA